ncbi:MAG: hypothetical protein R2734_19360 [Nocardioides sp.]
MTTPRLARRRVVQTGLATAALTPWQRTAEPAAAATPDRTFTVATFNVRAGQPARVYAESLRALMTRAALIGLQETHSPKFARALRRVLCRATLRRVERLPAHHAAGGLNQHHPLGSRLRGAARRSG